MDIIIKRRSPGSLALPEFKKPDPQSLYGRRFGEWGRVELPHSEDNTVDIYLNSGVHLKRVPVSSSEWVISGEDAEKDYNSGERNLPPKQARVFVIMPSLEYSDCFVAPFSGFSTIDQTIPYMEDDKERIKECITPSGWHITDNHGTGSHKAVSPDEKTSLEIDYGTEEEPKEDAPELHLSLFDEIKVDVAAGDNVAMEVYDEIKLEHVKGKSCTLKIFDTELIIKNGEVLIKPKKTTVEVDGDVTVKGANVNVEATGSAKVKAADVQITGGNLKVDGASSPGSGPFCALASCLFTGAPHTGNMVSGT
jgi:hypothetical protein